MLPPAAMDSKPLNAVRRATRLATDQLREMRQSSRARRRWPPLRHGKLRLMRPYPTRGSRVLTSVAVLAQPGRQLIHSHQRRIETVDASKPFPRPLRSGLPPLGRNRGPSAGVGRSADRRSTARAFVTPGSRRARAYDSPAACSSASTSQAMRRARSPKLSRGPRRGSRAERITRGDGRDDMDEGSAGAAVALRKPTPGVGRDSAKRRRTRQVPAVHASVT